MAKNKEAGSGISKKVMVCISLFLGIASMLPIVKMAFNRAFEKHSEETYQEFYQTAYDAAEKKNHTKNDASITVVDIKEKANLEVLQVSGIEYIMHEDDAEYWISIHGSGVYTVDLTVSEFVIDNERQYVLARIPKPRIENVGLGEHKKYFFGNGFFNGNISKGVDLAIEDRKSAQNQLQIKFASSQDYYEMAERSAEKLIKSLIESLNPGLPELVVEIEFIE